MPKLINSNSQKRNSDNLNAEFNAHSDKRALVHASIQRARSSEPRARVRFEETRSHSADPKCSVQNKAECLLLRPVSITSDQCRYSSPPSSASSAASIRNAPVGICACGPQPSSPSVSSSADRGLPSAGRAIPSTAAASSPVVQAGIPMGYGVANGARFPIYTKPEPVIKEPEVKLAPEVGVTGPSIPASTHSLRAAFPPAYDSDRGASKEDPYYPKDDDDLQCCSCGDIGTMEDDTFVCQGFIGDGSLRCLHVVCNNCIPSETNSKFPICPCTFCK